MHICVFQDKKNGRPPSRDNTAPQVNATDAATVKEGKLLIHFFTVLEHCYRFLPVCVSSFVFLRMP